MITTINFTGHDNGETFRVKAIQRGALAINAAIYTRGDGAKSTNGYVITHVPSGLAICRTRSVWKARRALRALLACGDWDMPVPVIDGHGDTSVLPATLRRRAIKVVKRFHERPYWFHP